MGMRPISWTVGQRPTVATIGRGPERGIPHIGTETRPKLLREAAVRSMGGSLNQPSSVQEDGPTGCKLLLRGDKGGVVTPFAGTARIRTG